MRGSRRGKQVPLAHPNPQEALHGRDPQLSGTPLEHKRVADPLPRLVAGDHHRRAPRRPIVVGEGNAQLGALRAGGNDGGVVLRAGGGPLPGRKPAVPDQAQPAAGQAQQPAGRARGIDRGRLEPVPRASVVGGERLVEEPERGAQQDPQAAVAELGERPLDRAVVVAVAAYVQGCRTGPGLPRVGGRSLGCNPSSRKASIGSR